MAMAMARKVERIFMFIALTSFFDTGMNKSSRPFPVVQRTDTKVPTYLDLLLGAR